MEKLDQASAKFNRLTNCEKDATGRSPENFIAAKKVDVGDDYE